MQIETGAPTKIINRMMSRRITATSFHTFIVCWRHMPSVNSRTQVQFTETALGRSPPSPAEARIVDGNGVGSDNGTKTALADFIRRSFSPNATFLARRQSHPEDIRICVRCSAGCGPAVVLLLYELRRGYELMVIGKLQDVLLAAASLVTHAQHGAARHETR